MGSTIRKRDREGVGGDRSSSSRDGSRSWLGSSLSEGYRLARTEGTARKHCMYKTKRPSGPMYLNGRDEWSTRRATDLFSKSQPGQCLVKILPATGLLMYPNPSSSQSSSECMKISVSVVCLLDIVQGQKPACHNPCVSGPCMWSYKCVLRWDIAR